VTNLNVDGGSEKSCLDIAEAGPWTIVATVDMSKGELSENLGLCGKLGVEEEGGGFLGERGGDDQGVDGGRLDGRDGHDPRFL